MDATDTYIVNGASKLALKEYGSVNAKGHTIIAMLCARIIRAAVSDASGERL